MKMRRMTLMSLKPPLSPPLSCSQITRAMESQEPSPCLTRDSATSGLMINVDLPWLRGIGNIKLNPIPNIPSWILFSRLVIIYNYNKLHGVCCLSTVNHKMWQTDTERGPRRVGCGAPRCSSILCIKLLYGQVWPDPVYTRDDSDTSDPHHGAHCAEHCQPHRDPREEEQPHCGGQKCPQERRDREADILAAAGENSFLDADLPYQHLQVDDDDMMMTIMMMMMMMIMMTSRFTAGSVDALDLDFASQRLQTDEAMAWYSFLSFSYN